MRKLLLPVIVIVSLSSLHGQVEVELTIENRLVIGTDFFFDIYLRRTAANFGEGDLYPGNTDLVLSFNAAAFSNPVFSKYPESPEGNCLFTPTDTSGSNTSATRVLYNSNLSTAIPGNLLVINLYDPDPADQNTFDTRVGKIDQAAGTHRLGTFRLVGLNGPPGNIGLTWVLTGTGLPTQIFSHENTTPWADNPATLIALDPFPFCTSLANPAPGSVNQPVNTLLTWLASAGSPAGYRLDAGTTPGGTNILNNVDAGNVTAFDPPGLLPYNSTIYVRIKPYDTNGMSAGCPVESFTTQIAPPACTGLASPANGATGILANTVLTWAAASGSPAGYRLDLGTTPGGTDILNNFDVGNVTTYDPPGYLPYGAIIYVKIKPYNATGSASGCSEQSFNTANCIPNLTIVSVPVPAGSHRSLGDLISNNSTIANGSVVIFNSDTGVLLDQHFVVEPGGIFEVNIQSCSTPANISTPQSDKKQKRQKE